MPLAVVALVIVGATVSSTCTPEVLGGVKVSVAAAVLLPVRVPPLSWIGEATVMTLAESPTTEA